MKGHEEEKMRKLFWLRPAFRRKSKYWRPQLLVFFFTLVAFVVAASIHFGKYRGYTDTSKKVSSSTSTQNSLSGNPQNTLIDLEYPLDCVAWNHSSTCPKAYPIIHNPSSSSSPPELTSCPEHFRWIHEDLKPWKHAGGITKSMVEKARRTATFRLTILNGKVYVEKFRDSIQTRALFTTWGIVQLMRFYPGRLPDLELMFDCDDRPVVPSKDYRHPGSDPPPLFRYCSDGNSLDIVFPDWSFWGWAETNIRPWRSELEDIKQGNKRTKWEDRVPYAYWKGNPHVCPWRADLMKCNVTAEHNWNAHLFVQDWIAESKKGYKGSSLGDQCTYRYKIYIEGWAWSVSEKYILACNSPTLLMTLRWHDFFIRGMVPQHDYWPVRDRDKCRSLKHAVEWGNNHTDKAKAIGESGSRFIHEDLKMEYVYDYIFHLLNEYAKLLKYKPTVPPNAVEVCPESLACSANGNWRKFMEESLVKSPSDSVPCSMPPPYTGQELKSFIDRKVKATKQVEAWENEYWNKQGKRQ